VELYHLTKIGISTGYFGTAPKFLILEILAADLFRRALGLPFPPGVLEIPDQFLLLRVHGHDRLSPPLERTDLLGDVLELSIPVGVGVAFPVLAVDLEVVTRRLEQPSHRLMADPVALINQGLRQISCALSGPAEGRLRVSSGRRIDQSLQVREECPILLGESLSPTTRTPDMRILGVRVRIGFGGTGFSDPQPDRRMRQPGGLRDSSDPTPPQGHRFARRPAPPHPLVHDQDESLILLSHDGNGSVSIHFGILDTECCIFNRLFWNNA
jgi:hypothetical protein